MKMSTQDVISLLSKQLNANSGFVALLEERILELEEDRERYLSCWVIYERYLFSRPSMLEEFVRFAYENECEHAKSAVTAIHDEKLDLSTLECTGSDFEPWR